MKTIAAVVYLSILVFAWHATASTSGFLVTGLGLALLLDRYLFRVLPWPPIAWKREGAVRGGSFVLGALGFYLMRPGLVPVQEAVYRGAMVLLVVFLCETLLGLVRPRRARLMLAGVLLAGFVLLIPVLAALHPLHTVPKRGPDAAGLACEDVHFTTADGVRLAGWLVPAPQARGNVIFCHGHGRNRGHVAGVLPTLHELGLNVLAFDFRGHGDSEGHTTTFGHREVGDLLAAEAFLRRRFPDQPLFLVGVSLGAAVSLQALPQLPQVRGVWSEGAFACFGDVVDNYFRVVPPVLRRPQVGLYKWLGWLDCGFWASDITPADTVREATCPVFICHAEADELVPLEEGRKLATVCLRSEHWWVSKATHYDVRQRNREEYLRRLREFLERCLAISSPSSLAGSTCPLP